MDLRARLEQTIAQYQNMSSQITATERQLADMRVEHHRLEGRIQQLQEIVQQAEQEAQQAKAQADADAARAQTEASPPGPPAPVGGDSASQHLVTPAPPAEAPQAPPTGQDGPTPPAVTGPTEASPA